MEQKLLLLIGESVVIFLRSLEKQITSVGPKRRCTIPTRRSRRRTFVILLLESHCTTITGCDDFLLECLIGRTSERSVKDSAVPLKPLPSTGRFVVALHPIALVNVFQARHVVRERD